MADSDRRKALSVNKIADSPATAATAASPQRAGTTSYAGAPGRRPRRSRNQARFSRGSTSVAVTATPFSRSRTSHTNAGSPPPEPRSKTRNRAPGPTSADPDATHHRSKAPTHWRISPSATASGWRRETRLICRFQRSSSSR